MVAITCMPVGDRATTTRIGPEGSCARTAPKRAVATVISDLSPCRDRALSIQLHDFEVPLGPLNLQ